MMLGKKMWIGGALLALVPVAGADNGGCCVFTPAHPVLGDCVTTTAANCANLGGVIQGVGTEFCDSLLGCTAGEACFAPTMPEWGLLLTVGLLALSGAMLLLRR